MIKEIKRFILGMLLIDAVVSTFVGVICAIFIGGLTSAAGGIPTVGEMLLFGLLAFGKMFVTGLTFTLAGGVCVAIAYGVGRLLVKDKRS